MSLQKIRLELARTKEEPAGNSNCGYEFIAPLDSSGHFDEETWREHRDACIVRRFWQGAADEHGKLIHTRGRRWVFSYAPGEDDDEPLFRFDRHTFKLGEYVAVTEHDGVTRPFRVAQITSLAMHAET
jgi:hypothetical protein